MLNPRPVQSGRSPYANRAGKSLPRSLSTSSPKTLHPRKRRRWLPALIILVVLIGIPYFIFSHLLGLTKGSFANGDGLSVGSLAEANKIQLKGEPEGRTNFMIYGLTADEARTDTLLLASYYWKEHKLVTLNIPRDLYASYQGYNGKIVSLYAISKQQKPQDRVHPAQFVSDFISHEYNIPIHYWVVANMQALKQMVDTLGGVTVENPRAFSDPQFPTDNYDGYIRPAPHFEAGTLNLNGTQALIYSRSRHSQDQPLEGTDFARSRRQEVVLQAILSKLKAQGAYTDLGQIGSYLKIFGQNIFTNLTPTETVRLGRTIDKLSFSQDYLKVNWSNGSGFFCDNYDTIGEYILLYGQTGNCHIKAGAPSQSSYKKEAVTFVQDLLTHASP